MGAEGKRGARGGVTTVGVGGGRAGSRSDVQGGLVMSCRVSLPGGLTPLQEFPVTREGVCRSISMQDSRYGGGSRPGGWESGWSQGGLEWGCSFGGKA